MARKTALIGILLLVSGHVLGADPTGPWLGESHTVPTLRLTEASYHVEVFGTLAGGTLVQTWVNDGGEVSVRYRTSGLQGLMTRSVDIEVDGEAVEDDPPDAPPEPAAKPARRGASRTARPSPSGPEVEIKPSQVASVRLGFESVLGIAEGTFLLRLPAPADPARERDPGLATDEQIRPLAWHLEIDWGGAHVESVRPTRLPDLYAGRAVTFIARVRGELPPTLKLHGTTVEGDRTFTVALPDASEIAYRQGEVAPR